MHLSDRKKASREARLVHLRRLHLYTSGTTGKGWWGTWHRGEGDADDRDAEGCAVSPVHGSGNMY